MNTYETLELLERVKPSKIIEIFKARQTSFEHDSDYNVDTYTIDGFMLEIWNNEKYLEVSSAGLGSFKKEF